MYETFRQIRFPHRWFRLALAVSLCLMFTACKNTDTLESMELPGTLKVVTRVGPNTYFQDAHGPSGYEYILAQEFANDLGLELKMIPVSNIEDMYAALRTGQADFAAAGLTVTDERNKFLRFSKSYATTIPQVLYKAGHKRPQTIADLNGGKLLVLANSSHAEKLRELKETHPELTWYETNKIDIPDILDMLEKGEIDYTILDSTDFQVNRGFFPKVRVAFDISAPEKIAWAMPKNGNEKLFQAMQRFMKKAHDTGLLDHLDERFYAHVEEVEQSGSQTFNLNIDKRLPKYEELIKEVAEEQHMDWRFLAAIAYQESFWNPKAKSPTGVRGMMMLTLTTAREMGIKNRLDARASLEGGAMYFKKIYQHIPDEIIEPDRSWFALAAYNVGWGHVQDARDITDFQGDDANQWVNVKKRLPLLQRKVWYNYTKYGYARGAEPVSYVQRIRHFYDLLSWHFPTPEEQQIVKPVDIEPDAIAELDHNPLPAFTDLF